MKKIFTLLSVAMLTLTATAQNYVFVDKDGNTVDDGAVITQTEAEDDGFGGILLQSGLSVKNAGAPANYQVRIHSDITQIDNGALQVCFPQNCHSYNTTGVNKSEEAKLNADETKGIQSEWLPTAYGECVVTYQAMALQPMGNLFIEKGGPKVTVHYVYADPSAVTAVRTSEPATVFYTLDGRRSHSLTKGISIVRRADGTVRKVLRK